MFLAALGLAAAVSGPDPYAIYARARSRWAAQVYPRYLSYVVQISGRTPDAAVTNAYDSFADTATNAIHVRATSAQEAANPYVPHGVSVKAKLKISYNRSAHLFSPPSVNGDDGDIHLSKTVQVTRREHYDLLGIPLLSPAYSFGMAPSALPVDGSNPTPAPDLKTIAVVTASKREYAIRYEGATEIDGAPCYHLALEPLRDPSSYRLRELWIDERTFATRRARVQGNFTAGVGPTLPWRIDFAVDRDVMYVSDERALAPVRFLGRTYEDVTVAFEDVEAASVENSLWNLTLFSTSGDVLKEP